MSSESRDAALARAAALLNYKNRSSRMRYDKLLEKGFSEEDSEYAVERLKELSYLNDAEYAASVVRECVRRGYGRERIERKLTEYKLSQEIKEEALGGLETDTEQLAELFGKLCRDISDRKEREKAAAKLKRRGFSWNDIDSAVRAYLEAHEEN